jgi:hypothetical protein
MDILNFISWIKGSRVVTTVDASRTLLPVGLKDPKRDDGYLAGAISVTDFASALDSKISVYDLYSNPPIQTKAIKFTGANYTISSCTMYDSTPGVCIQGDFVPSWLESDSSNFTIWNNGKLNKTTNTTFGEFSLESIGAGLSTGIQNCAFGYNTLKKNITGVANNAFGFRTLEENLANSNSAFGAAALFANTIGGGNTAVGSSTLNLNTTGSDHVAVGRAALSANTVGTENTAIGAYSCFRLNIGNYNTTLGNSAAYNVTGGSNNVALGYFSLKNNLLNGQNNTAVGANTSVSGDFTGSLILGADAQATASNQFVVGSSSVNAGTVVTAAQAQSKYWNVIINGVAQRILLA